MQVLKRHTLLLLISVVLAIALATSIVFITQNIPKPTTTPTPALSPTPTTPHLPTGNSPSPSTSTAPTLSIPPRIPNPTGPPPSVQPLPGEVITYQGQTLTPVNLYIADIIAHPDVAIKGTQYIDPATYRLAITGMINNPISYTYDDVVNSFHSTLQVSTLPCVEGWSATLLWQGVPISDLLQQTGVSPDANTLIFVAADGYSSSLPLDYVRQNNIMIAYKMNNITLTPQTGWPFFLVANNQYGYKWVEWLTEIKVSNNSNYLGYWESRGFPNNATVIGSRNPEEPSGGNSVVLPVAAVVIVCLVVAVVLLVVWRRRKGYSKALSS